METNNYSSKYLYNLMSLLHNKVILIVMMLIYKLFLDWCFCSILAPVDHAYVLEFNAIKYIIGLFICIILFFVPLNNLSNVSSFFIILINLTQIIPITTIYSFSNENTDYYLLLCFTFLICEILVVFSLPFSLWAYFDKKVFICLFSLVVFGMVLFAFVKYGVPSFAALNIYSVYEMRGNGAFSLNKYVGYVFKWMIYAIIPFLTAYCLNSKKYYASAFLLIVLCIFYLYSGHKAILFSVPLLILIGLWSRRKEFIIEFCIFFCVAFSLLLIVTLAVGKPSGIFYEIYSLICRRTMILSANNKFLYYDYFSKNPKLGFYGMIPSFILKINSPYELINYSYDISAVYYNAPEMNSNTGFFAEGYMRFGKVGMFVMMLIFSIILKQFDGFQKKNSYAFAATAFIVPVFLLNDAHLMDELVFGTWMVIEFILIFYSGANKVGEIGVCEKENSSVI